MVSSTPSFTQPFNSFSALFFRSPVSCVYSLRRIIGRSSRNLSNLRRRSSTGISAECANPDFAFSTNPRTFFRKEDEGRNLHCRNRWTAHVSLWHPLPDVLSTWLKNIRGRPIDVIPLTKYSDILFSIAS